MEHLTALPKVRRSNAQDLRTQINAFQDSDLLTANRIR
jgi:hypothetical protein